MSDAALPAACPQCALTIALPTATPISRLVTCRECGCIALAADWVAKQRRGLRRITTPPRSTADSGAIGRELYRQEQLERIRRERIAADEVLDRINGCPPIHMAELDGDPKARG